MELLILQRWFSGASVIKLTFLPFNKVEAIDQLYKHFERFIQHVNEFRFNSITSLFRSLDAQQV